MGFSLSRIPGTEILQVSGIGEGGIQEAFRVLEALAAQSLVPTLTAVLFDLRNLAYTPTPSEGRQIADAYGPFAAQRGCRFAYVCTPGFQFGMTRMVELQSQLHGAVTSTFTEFDEALHWLKSGVRPGGRRTTPGAGLSRPPS